MEQFVWEGHLDDNMKMASFQVLRVASMKMTVFSVVAPCSLIEVHRRFRGTSKIPLHDEIR
jgi:hypothetical protein